MSAYENGETEPEPPTLAVLAQVLRFPIDFFSAPEIDEPPQDAASFRALTAMTASQRDAALAAGALAAELGQWLERQFELPAEDVPSLDGLDPEAAASAVRRAWGLGEKPIRNLLHVLEQHGVRVFSLAEQCREVDAFSWWRVRTPYVFLNTQKSAEHSRFDAAHELGHLVLHRHGAPRGREAEEQANAFASSFLMPRGTLRPMVPRIPTFAQIVIVKRTWGVSAMALVHRLRRIGVLSEWQYRTFCVDFSRKGYRTHEPEPLPRETSQLLAKAFEALRAEGTGRQEVAKALRIGVPELDSLVFGVTLTVLAGDRSPEILRGRSRAHLKLV